MKKNFKFFIRTLLFVLFVLQNVITYAVPAYPGLIDFVQPDGTKIKIYLYGDEKISWAETIDGYSLMYNKDGFWEYAVLDINGDMNPSGIIANNETERNEKEMTFLHKVPKGLKYSKSQINMISQIWDIKNSKGTSEFPTIGDADLVCILIGFQDKALVQTNATFSALFNQINYTVGGAVGSVKDYYLETSYNQFDLTVTVAGPYVAANNMAYYGANSGNNHSIRMDELVVEALDFADPTVDFSLFDNDDDGEVDAVYIIFAGYGEESGGGANSIWSHAGYISNHPVDGKNVTRYSCSPEHRSNNGNNITRIGVICHEFGHVLGAKDFYDTNNSTGGSFIGTGKWDLMAGGSWNLGGARPAHHNAYIKIHDYGWADAIPLSDGDNITMLASNSNNNSFYRFETSNPGEYYLLENRQKQGFDMSVPGHGLLIYHVSANVSTNPNTTHPQEMYPVCASANTNPNASPGSYGAINSTGCTYPGVYNKTSFSDETLPSSFSWEGDDSYQPIQNISENNSNKTISFCFNCDNARNFNSVTISYDKIDLSWDHNLSNNDVMVAFSTSNNFGNPLNGHLYSPGEAISGGGTVLYSGDLTSYSHINLTGNTTYYYKAWSILSGNSYSSGSFSESVTFCTPTNTFPMIEGFEDNGVLIPSCWTSFRGENNVGILQDWRTSSTSHSGSRSAFLQFEDVSSELAQDWLVSTSISIPTEGEYFLKYYEKQYSSTDKGANFYIKISETSQTLHSSFVDLFTYNETSFGTSFSERSISLDAYAGKTIFIAFVIELDASGDAWYIDDFKIDQGSGIQSAKSYNNTKIFPNPTEKEFFITSDLNEPFSVIMRDVTGKIVLEQAKYNDKQKIDMLTRKKGLYFVEIHFKNHIEILKLIYK